MKSILINLYGGPGIGKSTTAAKVFSLLKDIGEDAVYVTEVAKEKQYTGQLKSPQLKNTRGISILCEQFLRLAPYIGCVDYIVTDSPLELCLTYGGPHLTSLVESMNELVLPLDVLLVRNRRPYSEKGRSQSNAEARVLDGLISDRLHRKHAKPPLANGFMRGNSEEPEAIVSAAVRLMEHDLWS